MHLQGATALVTGAAQGFGEAFSKALLSCGASVCLCDMQEQKGKAVEQELQKEYGKEKVLFIQCDVRYEEQLSNVFSEAISKFGHIDLMVNNAGIANESRPKDMIDINLFGVIKGSQLAIDHMRKDQGGKGGTIINIASIAGLEPVFYFPAYTAVKYGVVGFTQSWASNPHIKELGIQLACLCPGLSDTAMLDTTSGDRCLYPDEMRKVGEQVGIIAVNDVARAFMQLVESVNCNGDIMKITKGHGIEYVKKNCRPVKPNL